MSSRLAALGRWLQSHRTHQGIPINSVRFTHRVSRQSTLSSIDSSSGLNDAEQNAAKVKFQKAEFEDSDTQFKHHEMSTAALTELTNCPQLLVDYSPNGLCHLEINRPAQLNAINYPIAAAILRALRCIDSTDYPSCNAVLLTGNGEKAFCAGGDVRSAASGTIDEGLRFFRAEYAMDRQVSIMRKPHIAIWKGIVMGGGVGVSIHGKYRISTSNTRFAMPEGGIGFFPDVGASLPLSKLEHGVGLYLGLTGTSINGCDAYRLGLATHFITLKSLPAFIVDLKNAALGRGVTEILERYHDPSCDGIEPTMDDATLQSIRYYFGSGYTSLQNLMKRLRANQEADVFCKKTAEAISKNCPLSCAVWEKQLEKVRGGTLEDALRMDYKLAQAFCGYDANFKEGVRARLVDKDNNPIWNPTSLEELQDSQVEKMFDHPGANSSLDDFDSIT